MTDYPETTDPQLRTALSGPIRRYLFQTIPEMSESVDRISTLKESLEMFNIYDLKFGREAQDCIQVLVSFPPLQDRYAITVAVQGRP